jgi:MFS family permease
LYGLFVLIINFYSFIRVSFHLCRDDSFVNAIWKGAGDAASLVQSDIRLALIMPYQLAFGFASSFVPFYVFGVIVSDSNSLGGDWVGLLSAVVTLTGASMGLPAAYISNRFGKPVVMIFGGLCLLATSTSLFFLDNPTIGSWKCIVVFLMVYGIGRGTWENTNKAVIADFYTDTPNLCTAAFASISFSSGFSGAVAYFIYPSLGRFYLAGVVACSALVGLLSYGCLVVTKLHKKKLYMIIEEEGKQ